ncbi:MAG TPA: 4-phosphopantoate--beta-alanine ligase [Nitrososphaeraceae archaeon]|nr:4-phosphopantoate--beta-alanine ligase [Nitrososphaeraceae archaeon]
MHRTNIPSSHPRAKSLYIRELLVNGFKNGIVVQEGLIAHGRGETFDYLLGEGTTESARIAIKAACSLLLVAVHPVISVNGNVAALCSKEVVELSNLIDGDIEVNLFYWSEEREIAIEKELKKMGAKKVLGIRSGGSARIPELRSERRIVDQDGIYKADTVLVPLEDGDRTEALVKMHKKVIAIDLNPLSRTSKAATVTVIDNVIRALPAMAIEAKQLKQKNGEILKKIVNEFDNSKNLSESLKIIRCGVNARQR